MGNVIVIGNHMQTTLLKEKPDLLFNNPLKQKVYVFLKSNPGKEFETFQVFTGDTIVSRQLFNEVEQAIRSREEREKSKGSVKEANNLFLFGSTYSKPRPVTPLFKTQKSDIEETTLKKFEKKKLNERAKQYIQSNPDCTYEDLIQSLNFRELTKPHFFSMKTQLRKKGLISHESRARRGRKPGSKSTNTVRSNQPVLSKSNTKTIEILESIDASDFTEEIREHYKVGVLPLLKRLLPNGENLQLVMLSDPPTIEIRRNLY